jgi:hypothetical protein
VSIQVAFTVGLFFLACLFLLFSCPAPVTSGPKSLYYPNETQTQWWRSERGE